MNLVLDTLLLILRLFHVFLTTILNWFVPAQYKSVKGEVCLITGSGSGLGRLMALEFAKRGAVLVLWDIDEKGNEETASMITESGGKAFAQKCDVSDKDDVSRMAQKAKMAAGDITILINNAGIVYGKDFLDLTDDEIERTMKVNTFSHFWTVRAFLPSMMEKNHGHIVAISSIMGFLGASGAAAYAASKHAVLGFADSLEKDLKRQKMDGIKTTVACPSQTNTGMFSGVNARFPALNVILEPKACVDDIMHAILTDRAMIVLPRMMYFVYNMRTWMPRKAELLLLDFTGYLESMRKFVPTRDYQIQAAAK